ncbi:MAG: hypothetical protein JJE22_11580 [Bacteroidia bacterium]|nr:hypothetical protein [Bacteroidia bacterium]
MKPISIKFTSLFFCAALFTSISLQAQNLTGIWRGYFISDGGDQYKLEFQISQNRSNVVSGVSYSYLDVRFYGKATMTGSFIKSSSSFRIREIKTVEVKSILGGATCIMNYNFVYTKSGREEFLDGTYLGKYELKYKTTPPPSWGDCGAGKVYLRKVPTSDFYVEPFLRNKIKNNTPAINNEAPIKKDPPKVSAPAKKPPVTNNSTANKNSPTSKPVIKNNKPVIKKPLVKTESTNNNPIVHTPEVENKDTAKKIIPPITNSTPPKQLYPAPEILKSRKNELVKMLVVHDPDVTVKLYDNGEIDGDTISVYMDNKLVLNSKGLTASPLILKFKMDEDNSDHELVLVAENLGRIPPNTALMIVESGDQRFDVRITSTEQKNAMVKFKYQKPD